MSLKKKRGGERNLDPVFPGGGEEGKRGERRPLRCLFFLLRGRGVLGF